MLFVYLNQNCTEPWKNMSVSLSNPCFGCELPVFSLIPHLFLETPLHLCCRIPISEAIWESNGIRFPPGNFEGKWIKKATLPWEFLDDFNKWFLDVDVLWCLFVHVLPMNFMITMWFYRWPVLFRWRRLCAPTHFWHYRFCTMFGDIWPYPKWWNLLRKPSINVTPDSWYSATSRDLLILLILLDCTGRMVL